MTEKVAKKKKMTHCEIMAAILGLITSEKAEQIVRMRLADMGPLLLKATRDPFHNRAISGRVAKCHRYGRYICVEILEGWGKMYGRPYSFVN